MNSFPLTDAPALLKILLFLLFWLIFWIPIAFPLARRLDWKFLSPVTASQKIPLVAGLYAIAPPLVWGILALENSSLAEHGIAWGVPLFLSGAIGFFLAALGLAIVFSIESTFGWVTWKPENLGKALSLSLPILLLALWVGVTEETIFRGLFLDWLEKDTGRAIAAILSSSVFALVHLLWERRETVSQLPGLWLMGMVLALSRAIDGGSLGLAWGLHAGWVWGLALLDSAELMTYSDLGSPWLKGFNNNPLAGLAGILCLFGTGLGLFFLPQ